MLVIGLLWILEQVLWLINLPIPNPAPPGLAGMATSIMGAGVTNFFGWLNNYVPLDQMAAATGAVFTVFAVMWLVRLVGWLLGKVHVLGGDG